MMSPLGLSAVSEAALTTLLRAVYRGELSCPLTLPDLTRHGLQYCASDLQAALRGLDERAVSAVLICVIAERRATIDRAKQAEDEAARPALIE